MRFFAGACFAILAVSVLTGFPARATEPIGSKEALSIPTPQRLAAIHSAAQNSGWRTQTAQLRATALRAYEAGKLPAATAWFQVYRWALVFGQPEDEFVPRWIQAVQNARVAHRGMSAEYRARPITLSAYLSPACQAWLIGHPAFGEEFFSVVRPVDYLPAVFKVLDELHGRDDRTFEAYANLALALAVVYDIDPPPEWPHPQVASDALPHRWPSVVRAFAWWTKEDREGRTYHKLGQLQADELKFVVDSTAPFDELEWTQQVANYPLDQLDRAYKMVTYRQDRAANSRPFWTEKDYALPTILGAGGICVDQAYFAAEVGKARGVPTLIFQGAGSNGRHAWFGFLDSKQKWRLDAGRFAEQRFVTGTARNPQTWGPISDHELQFLAERFRSQRSFRTAEVHAAFAADFLAMGEMRQAEDAARRAIAADARNQPAWETLLAAEGVLGRGVKLKEETLEGAMRAFERYPDVEVFYSAGLSRSLRDRGDGVGADAVDRRLARKYKGSRQDLTLQIVRANLLRSVQTEPVPEQMKTYYRVLDEFGRAAGIAFFDQIVVTFVDHLTQLHHYTEARQAAERARATLKVELNSQLEQEFEALLKRVRSKT